MAVEQTNTEEEDNNDEEEEEVTSRSPVIGTRTNDEAIDATNCDELS